MHIVTLTRAQWSICLENDPDNDPREIFTTQCSARQAALQFAMYERYPGSNPVDARRVAQLDRWCPRIPPPTRHLTRTDRVRRSVR